MLYYQIIYIFLTLILGKYWLDIKNRRNFYLKFAQSRGFDPLVGENWSKYNADHVMAAKV